MNYTRNFKSAFFSILICLAVFSNFSYAQSASISGRVSNGLIPLLGFVDLYLIGSDEVVKEEVFTVGADGRYTFSNVADGNYIVRTSLAAEESGKIYVNQVYSGKPCPLEKCDLKSGTPIAVQNALPVSGIDFILAYGSIIQGHVYGGGAPITSSVYVSVFDAGGELLAKRPADKTGAYTIGGISPGTYYVAVSNRHGFIDELYPSIPCPNDTCNKVLGTPIVITQTASVVPINFDLTKGGKISGVVRMDKDKTALRNIPVLTYLSDGLTIVDTSFTDKEGKYITSVPLPGGAYYVRTSTTALQNKVFSDLACSKSCNLLAGTPVVVSSGKTDAKINFYLDQASSGKKVDLTAKWMAPPKDRPYLYTLSIVNQGEDAAGGFDVKVYRSRSRTVSDITKPIKLYHLGSLASKSSRHYNLQLKRSSVARYAIAIVDTAGMIPEKNKKNNTVYTPL